MMRQILRFSVVTVALSMAHQAQSQILITESFKLPESYNNPTVQKQIEKTFSCKGIKFVNLDKEQNLITVTYNVQEIDALMVHQKAEICKNIKPTEFSASIKNDLKPKKDNTNAPKKETIFFF